MTAKKRKKRRPPAEKKPAPKLESKAPKSSGVTAPKLESKPSKSSTTTAPRSGGKTPKTAAPAPPKAPAKSGTGGKAPSLPPGSGDKLPAPLPDRREHRQPAFSSRVEEIPLTAPPADPARELSELLRLQRRMAPNATGFGEEVL